MLLDELTCDLAPRAGLADALGLSPALLDELKCPLAPPLRAGLAEALRLPPSPALGAVSSTEEGYGVEEAYDPALVTLVSLPPTTRPRYHARASSSSLLEAVPVLVHPEPQLVVVTYPVEVRWRVLGVRAGVDLLHPVLDPLVWCRVRLLWWPDSLSLVSRSCRSISAPPAARLPRAQKRRTVSFWIFSSLLFPEGRRVHAEHGPERHEPDALHHHAGTSVVRDHPTRQQTMTIYTAVLPAAFKATWDRSYVWKVYSPYWVRSPGFSTSSSQRRRSILLSARQGCTLAPAHQRYASSPRWSSPPSRQEQPPLGLRTPLPTGPPLS